MYIRKPVAYGFYKADPEQLHQQITDIVTDTKEKKKAICAVAPHAGYAYSGHTAAAVFSRIIIPDTCLVLCPRHRPMGEDIAIMTSGAWEMPFGNIEINEELAQKLLDASDLIKEDTTAHEKEHSIEVQLPFLHYFNPDVKFVPLSISNDSYTTLTQLGEVIALALKAFDGEVLIVASTDMSHYVSQDEAKRLDSLAIAEIEKLKPKGLYQVVRMNTISMCGVLPVTVALTAANELGAQKAELIEYRTSGEVTGDYNQVVGYAGLIIT